MPYLKMVKFLERLLTRTRSGVLHWEPTAKENSYLASFSSFSVVIAASGSEENCIYTVEIYDFEGNVIERLSHNEFGNVTIGGLNPEAFMEDLYKTIRRQVHGVDQALDQMMKEMGFMPEEECPY